MNGKWTYDDASEEPPWKKPKSDKPDDLKLNSPSNTDEILDAEKKSNTEQVNASATQSKRLTTETEFKEEEKTCLMASLDACLLQCLYTGDLMGTLKILKAAQSDECPFTQNTLDAALLSAARQGFFFVVQTLLYLGANIESSDGDGSTALILSVERNSLDMVEFLLKKGANAKAIRKSTGDSCLLLAIQPGGSFQIARLVLEHGSDIDLQNKKGDTALICAFKCGNLRVVHLLLKSGANADRCNKFGQTARAVAYSVGMSNFLTSMSSLKDGIPALVKAVEMKDIRLLEVLLDNKVENVDDVHWKNNISTTALEFAFGKIGCKPLPDSATTQIFETMISILLKEGANVNRSINGQTMIDNPLFVAVTAGRCDLIDLLIQYGVSGLSKAFDLSLLVGNVECAGLLLRRGAKGNFTELALRAVLRKQVNCFKFLCDKCQVDATDPLLIHTAVKNGHIDMVRLLIELGADVNAQLEAHPPVLHQVKDIAMATLLVDNKADLNSVQHRFTFADYHELPLTIAIKENKIDLVQFYMSRGANISYNVNGLPVLQCLCDNPNAKILDLFLAAGINIDYRNESGESTLMWAVKHNKKELLKLLIDKGADVNLGDNDGITPLMHAAAMFNYDADNVAMKCLINAGADTNKLDFSRNSALLHCAKCSHTNTINRFKLLVEAGACVNVQNDYSETALSISHSFEKAKILLDAGADANATDKYWNTPLMNSVYNNFMVDKEHLRIFLEHGADVNFVNRKSFKTVTALSIAFRKWVRQRRCKFSQASHVTIINLLEAGADPNLTESTKCLLHWAILFNQRSLIPILVTSGLTPRECDDVFLRHECKLPYNVYSSRFATVSPFTLALCLGRLSIAKFLADRSFFTKKDIGRGYKWANYLRKYLRGKGYLQTLAFVDEFISEPKSLVDLSSVVASAKLERYALDWEVTVMSAELPLSLKHRLLFQHTRGRLETDIDETLEDDEYNLTVSYMDSDDDDDVDDDDGDGDGDDRY